MKCPYNKIMMRAFTLCSFLTVCFSAMGATQSDHWYKVETKEKPKTSKKAEDFHYDSLENPVPMKKFVSPSFWSLRPKLTLGAGFHADKNAFKGNQWDRLFLIAGARFFVQPWHRWTAQVQLLQNNTMFVSAAWEITHSREAARSYYGFGLAHLLLTDKEFSNFVEPDSYHLTAHYGWEFLLEKHRAWNTEVKAFWSGNNYALQLSVGYLIGF
jgi:hypothetical protein